MNLILTFDYELFGDGSGNVFTHIIEPTNQILQLCSKHNIKITIFFEVLEYIKLKEEWDKGNTMGYTDNPIEAIENQIQQAALVGHDIQLHIHPQWYNAKYENGKWHLNVNNWRLGDFKGENNYNVKELISDCKTALEDLIKPVNPHYKCIGLRAGGYNIMLSDEVHVAMVDLDMKYDSSVYPGGYETGNLSKYDYRNVSLELSHWWADANDIRKISDKGKEILEIPIFALPVARWKRILTPSKIKSLLLRKNNVISSNSKEKIKFMLQHEASTWDVCMFPQSLHKKFFKHIESKMIDKRDSYVLIGHPKSLQQPKLFANFISIAKNRKFNYKFLTLSEYYESIV